MIIFGEKGFIGSHLANEKLPDNCMAYLFGRSDGGKPVELYRQIETLHNSKLESYQHKIVYASSIYLGRVINPYTLTKGYTEYYFNDKKATGLRFCGIYGNGGKGIINKLVDAARTGKMIIINDPFVQREFMHVEDACRWIIKAVNSDKKIIQAGSGQRTNIHNLVELIEEVSGKKINVDYVKTKEEPKQIFCSESIENPITLKEGIERLWKEL